MDSRRAWIWFEAALLTLTGLLPVLVLVLATGCASAQPAGCATDTECEALYGVDMYGNPLEDM